MKKTLHNLMNNDYPAPLCLLIMVYALLLVMSNLFDAKQISLLGVNLVPGVFLFILTYICADVITEVYGYKFARLAIWLAFIFNLFYLGYTYLVYILPSPNYAVYQDAFEKLMTTNSRIVLASMVSYFIAEPTNAFLVAKIKIILSGQYIGIRFILSTVISSIFDSFLFVYIAFFNVFPAIDVFQLTVNLIVVKIIIELLIVPFSIRLAIFLKKFNRIDRYDAETKFNLFSLNTSYKNDSNRYKREL